MTREEILQAFDDINFVYNDCTRYDTLKRMLEELTERKRGEWIQQRDEYWGVFWFNCSVCGHKPPNDQFGQEWHSNFCPNCGAEMEHD